MKSILRTIIVTMALLLVVTASGYADSHGGGHGGGHYGGYYGHGGHTSVGVWFGPGWWGGPYYAPYYSYYPYYPYYPYYQSPPVVIQQQPDLYVQPVPQTEAPPTYWYYCQNPQGYYPYVKACPGGWSKVLPNQPSGQKPADLKE